MASEPESIIENDTQQTAHTGMSPVRRLFRKFCVVFAVGFVLWNYVTKTLYPAPVRPTHAVAKNVRNEPAPAPPVKQAVTADEKETETASPDSNKPEIAESDTKDTTPAPEIKPETVAKTETPAPFDMPVKSDGHDADKEHITQPESKSTEQTADRQRITQLEEKLKEQNADKDRITLLEEKLHNQDNDKQHLAELETKLQEQQTALLALKTQLANSQLVSNGRLTALTEFSALKDDVLRGEAFATPLQLMMPLVEDNAKALELLKLLTPYAQKGVMVLSALQLQFDDLLTVALNDSSKNTSLVHNLKSLVRIRKIGEYQKGGDDEAIIARAEAKLGRSDVDGALNEITQLTPGAAKTFAPWIANAKSFLLARNTLDALQLAIAQDHPPAKSDNDAPAHDFPAAAGSE